MSALWFDICLTLLTIGSGIVLSGLVSSVYHITTNDIPKFSMLNSQGLDLFIKIFVIIFSGPIMLLRNCYYGRVLENRPLRYVFGGAMIAASWGMLNGLYVTSAIVTLMQ